MGYQTFWWRFLFCNLVLMFLLIFCRYRGFSHCTESDLFPFLFAKSLSDGFEMKRNIIDFFTNRLRYGMRVSRGGGGGPDPPPPPWDFSEVGSCVDIWWVGEGVQRLFLSYFHIFFWIAPLASIIHIVNIWRIRITSKFKELSLLQSYTLSLAVPVLCLFCLKLHDFTSFKPKKILGRTPSPPPHCDITYTFYKLKQ